MQDGDNNSTTKSAAKAFANKYRGIMMRPMTTAVTKAQADFKPFVAHPEEIDHNLYGKFLGILKGMLSSLLTVGVSQCLLCRCWHALLMRIEVQRSTTAAR